MDRTIYKSLLSKISENLHTGVPRGNNDTFNIFTVLGVETKEVILCRLLRELLDPRGSHRLGEKPLLLFVQNVLGYPDFNESEAKKAKVIAEETIADNRRVDLVIRTGEKTIPIEVKVWAGDQDAQLSDYYNYYRSNGLNCIFYLTPTGWTPSARSRGDLQVEKEIRLLAFDKSIKPWLKSLIPYCEHESVRICVEQFTEVIEKMCAANAELEVIQNILGLNEETFDTANPLLEAFVAIMNNGKDIAFKIKQRYLQQYIEPVEGFDLVFDLSKEDTKQDSHAVARIERNGNVVAWLCVAENLYLVAREVKTTTGLWDEVYPGGKKYCWAYVVPDNHKKKTLALGDLKEMPQSKIPIAHLLCDIKLVNN